MAVHCIEPSIHHHVEKHGPLESGRPDVRYFLHSVMLNVGMSMVGAIKREACGVLSTVPGGRCRSHARLHVGAATNL